MNLEEFAKYGHDGTKYFAARANFGDGTRYFIVFQGKGSKEISIYEPMKNIWFESARETAETLTILAINEGWEDEPIDEAEAE